MSAKGFTPVWSARVESGEALGLRQSAFTAFKLTGRSLLSGGRGLIAFLKKLLLFKLLAEVSTVIDAEQWSGRVFGGIIPD